MAWNRSRPAASRARSCATTISPSSRSVLLADTAPSVLRRKDRAARCAGQAAISSAPRSSGIARSWSQGWVAGTGFSAEVGGVSFRSWLRTKGAGVSGVGSSPVTFRPWCRRVALGIEEHSPHFLSAFFGPSRGWLESRLRTHSRASLWGERDRRTKPDTTKIEWHAFDFHGKLAS